MNHPFRRTLTLLALGAAMTLPAWAQDAPRVVDRGRFVAFLGDLPFATERFVYEVAGDSLLVTMKAERRVRGPGGAPVRFAKLGLLTLNADSYGLLRYVSSESTAAHLVKCSVLPNDTMLISVVETNGRGEGTTIERPPGRFLVLDPGLFSMFDVMARSFHGRVFGERPFPVVVVGDVSRTTEVIVTPAGNDTVPYGGRRVVTERYVLRDSSGTYTVWTDPHCKVVPFGGSAG